ncbi:MAG: beta-lactamase family protein [Gammaproteobacteria bacterium]|nr:beta-lactamase family protein [Gammaproteobacteria bacterium]
MFRIDLVGSASVEIRASGQTDTRGELLDGSGTRIQSDENSGAGDNFRIVVDLEPGIYYVEVSGSAGDYSVFARLGDAPDHGDTAATATLLTLYDEADLAEVSPNALLAMSGRIWPSTADVDVFRLDVRRDASEVTVRTAGPTDTYGRVLDGALNELASDDGEGSFLIEVRLDTGTYYVEVGGHEVGAYRVLAWDSADPCACEVALPGVDRSIGRYLTEPIEKGDSPGLIAAIVDADGIRAIAADGVRRAGSPDPILVTDRVHIGSNTKAMTSVMLATLVADGSFEDGWETTLGDVYPELRGEIHENLAVATLWEFVSMASGVKRNASDWWAHLDKGIVERRYAILLDDLAEAPAHQRGTYNYSNLGYMVAGAMAERVTGRSWERLMRERLFGPLGMSSAGFGPPGTAGEADQPWGHRRDSAGMWAPNQFDNAEALGPAGTVHVGIEDWAKFVALWFPDNAPGILDREALDRLTRPAAGSYAAGWSVLGRPWARGVALYHSGSNASWFTTLWVAPAIARAYIVAGNAAEMNLDDTLWMQDRIVASLIGHARDDVDARTIVVGGWPYRASVGPGLVERIEVGR